MLGASACLVGLKTRYDGTSATDPKVYQLFLEGKIIPFCPEQLGGLTTPRARAEIADGSGEDVLEGKSAVVTADDSDVTLQYLHGAEEVVRIARELGIKRFYLKSKSPACGFGKIYVQGRLTKGNGVCAAALVQAGIDIVSV